MSVDSLVSFAAIAECSPPNRAHLTASIPADCRDEIAPAIGVGDQDIVVTLVACESSGDAWKR